MLQLVRRGGDVEREPAIPFFDRPQISQEAVSMPPTMPPIRNVLDIQARSLQRIQKPEKPPRSHEIPKGSGLRDRIELQEFNSESNVRKLRGDIVGKGDPRPR
eukprot:6467837-Pyramimonas_sp.AAC.1